MNKENEVKEELEELKSEVIEKISTLITSAFGLVAALAWNEAIKALFSTIFGSTNQLVPMIIYALVVTIIAVIVTIWIGRMAGTKKESK